MTRKKKKKETYPHFRFYKKSGHPALIVGEQPIDEYQYRKVTHAEKEAGRKNEKVYPNPNPKDKDPMYISKRVRHDKKVNFGKKYPWRFEDKKK